MQSARDWYLHELVETRLSPTDLGLLVQQATRLRTKIRPIAEDRLTQTKHSRTFESLGAFGTQLHDAAYLA